MKTSLQILALLSALLCGCASRADLIVDPPGTTANCPSDTEETLVVSISNQGGKFSKSTTTRLQFGNLPPVDLPTRPVPPKGSVSIRFRVPDTCYRPQCPITIRVDLRNEVEESREDNNVMRRVCP